MSECTKRDIVDFFGIDPSKIEVIYQGCDEMFAQEITEADTIRVRQEYNLPLRYMITVGTLESRKNLREAVEALLYLPADMHLVAVGRATPYTEEVMRYAAQQGLTSRIHLCIRSLITTCRLCISEPKRWFIRRISRGSEFLSSRL